MPKTTVLPLRLSLEHQDEYEEIRAGLPELTAKIPTSRRIALEFSIITGNVLLNYRFDAVGPIQLDRSVGELSKDDRAMLRETRRLINQLLDE